MNIGIGMMKKGFFRAARGIGLFTIDDEMKAHDGSVGSSVCSRTRLALIDSGDYPSRRVPLHCFT